MTESDGHPSSEDSGTYKSIVKIYILMRCLKICDANGGEGLRDTSIRVWRLPDISQPVTEEDEDCAKFLKYTLMEHEHSVRDLATYGNILVSGSYDNNVIIWDLETEKRLHNLDGHQMKVYSVMIDTKRRQCISGSLDASAMLFWLVYWVAFDERRCVAVVKIDRLTQLVVLDYGIHGLEYKI
ncbi:hypothetical protein K501DRAFT_278885 [Backusella circina FSU 941]|nr:hypothetical protein K501DRAFT_278885 [Backusella circina FSU 941]